jgi:succinyl-CoA synthetase beta subunit
VVDRGTGRVALIVSTEGGMDIEEVAHSTPEKITTIVIDPAQGFMPHHGRAVAFALKLSGFLNKQAQQLAKSSTKRSSRSIAPCSKSIRWSKPGTGSCWSSTPS